MFCNQGVHFHGYSTQNTLKFLLNVSACVAGTAQIFEGLIVEIFSDKRNLLTAWTCTFSSFPLRSITKCYGKALAIS